MNVCIRVHVVVKFCFSTCTSPPSLSLTHTHTLPIPFLLLSLPPSLPHHSLGEPSQPPPLHSSLCEPPKAAISLRSLLLRPSLLEGGGVADVDLPQHDLLERQASLCLSLVLSGQVPSPSLGAHSNSLHRRCLPPGVGVCSLR